MDKNLTCLECGKAVVYRNKLGIAMNATGI